MPIKVYGMVCQHLDVPSPAFYGDAVLLGLALAVEGVHRAVERAQRHLGDEAVAREFAACVVVGATCCGVARCQHRGYEEHEGV